MNTSTNSCRRTLNVENATSVLNNVVDELGCAVGELESALAPLLSPEPPCGPSSDREGGQSEVAERVMADAYRVRSHVLRIRELIERL